MILLLFFAFISFNQLIQPELYTLYAHGIVDKPSQVERFIEAISTDQNHTKAVLFQDTQKETGYGINRLICEITLCYKKQVSRSKMYMGQKKDIESVHTSMQEISSNDHVILYGSSRGAAALITYLSTYNPSNIAALVLDASVASMPATIDPMLAKFGIHNSYDAAIFSALFPAYPLKASTPLQMIKHIKNKNLPILLIHSQTDCRVSFDHSLMLYKELKQQNFTQVYLARISHGKHSFLLQDESVKNIYLQAVHSFYKKHNLPYHKEFGHDNMTLYEPDLEQVEQEIQYCKLTLQKQYEQSKLRNMIIAITTAALIAYILHKKKK